MVKALLSTIFLFMLAQNALASDKAFAVLLSYGFTQNDLLSFVKSYPELKDLDVASESSLKNGEEFSKELTLKLYAQDSNDAYIIIKSELSSAIEKVEAQYEIEVKTIDGEIKNTLHDTIFKETKSEVLANQMSEAFKEDFSTTKGLRRKAYYQFQVEQYYEGDKFVKYGNILSAALVVGSAINKKVLKIDPDTFSWTLLPEDAGLHELPFYAPVKSLRVSSLFQLNRRHPVTRRHQPHNGIDFVAPSGTAIYPALDGEVVTVGRTRSKGKFVTILHDNGYLTTYIHLKKFQKGLRVGMRVGLEDQIGEVGRTGYSTGAHLHFGIIKDGYFVNPIYLLKNYGYSQKAEYETVDEIEDSEEVQSTHEAEVI